MRVGIYNYEQNVFDDALKLCISSPRHERCRGEGGITGKASLETACSLGYSKHYRSFTRCCQNHNLQKYLL